MNNMQAIDDDILEDLQGNTAIKDYYNSVAPKLKIFKVSSLSDSTIILIANFVNATRIFSTDWREYISDLYKEIDSRSLLLNEVDAFAVTKQKLPFYVALMKTSEFASKQEKTLEELTRVFLERKRFDILGEIRPKIEDILNRHAEKPSNGVGHLHSNGNFDASLNRASTGEIVELPGTVARQRSPLSVFVPHTCESVEEARELAHLLYGKHNCTATLMCDVGSSRDSLSTVFQEVDFVVPLVSDLYLEYIRSKDEPGSLGEDAKNNRMIYNWMQDEYELNRRRNYRVRPVFHITVDAKSVKEALFQFHYYLFKQVPKLIRDMTAMKMKKRHS